MHDLAHIDFYNSFINKFYYKFFIKFIYRNSNRIFTISEFSKFKIMNLLGFKSSQIHVVCCGINENFFSKKKIKPILKFSYILCVSNRKKHKNEDLLLNGFLEIAKLHNYKLILLGNSTFYQDEFILNNNLNDKIIFLNSISDNELVSLYRHAKALICPSLYEGFSLPVAEAMASRIPIFISDIPVHHEISGENAIFFDSNSHFDLARKFNKNIKHYDSKMIDSAYDLSKKYKWGNVCKNINKIINNKDMI